MFSFALGTALVSLALSAPAHAHWVIGHGTLTRDRLDPIVSPGQVSSHVHTVVGSSAFASTMSFADMQRASCSTSPVQADKSNYWAPQMYHHNKADNTYTLIPISFVNTYYLPRGGPNTPDANVQGFPEGLRMVAGDPFRTTYDAARPGDAAVSFVCLSYNDASNDAAPSPRFPGRQCPDGLRAQVVFPSCWDGVNVDSPDHKAHMAYPVGSAVDTGDCPASHPVKVITLFHEWTFVVNQFDYVDASSWVFANGGNDLAFHADFIMGWDKAVLDAAVKQCTAPIFAGDLAQCAPFVASLDQAKASACTLPSTVQENIAGPLAQLPGCNPVTGGGVAAPGAACSGLVTPAIGNASAVVEQRRRFAAGREQ